MSHEPPAPAGRETSSRTAAAAPRRRRVAVLVVVALGAILAYLALRTSPYLQYIPWMPRQLGVWADRNGIARNVVAFFGLALVVYVLVGRRVVHVGLLCLFGAALEVSQIWIRGRVFDWKDIVASIAGVLIAWPLAWLLRRRPA